MPSIGTTVPSPSFMIAPLPWLRSIICSAPSSAGLGPRLVPASLPDALVPELLLPDAPRTCGGLLAAALGLFRHLLPLLMPEADA
jgi:hypothetical protein